ncbi:unnamed protein product, partial [Nesidiocoris tenuis]
EREPLPPYIIFHLLDWRVIFPYPMGKFALFGWQEMVRETGGNNISNRFPSFVI